MIKLFYCLSKRPDVTAEFFHKYWLEKHGPLVRSFAGATRVKKYIQNHTIQPEINEAMRKTRGLPPPYDGIVEVWYENLEVLKESLKSPAAQENDLSVWFTV